MKKILLIIFVLNSIILNAQSWQKLGEFQDYDEPLIGVNAITSFDYNAYSNKLYVTYFNQATELNVFEFNGTNWHDISPMPKIKYLFKPRVNLKCGIGDSNVYVLLADSFLVYNSSNWTTYSLPGSDISDNQEFEIAIHPTTHNPYIAREAQLDMIGAVLRVDEFTGNSWNHIDQEVLNNTSHGGGNGDFLSFKFKPSGDAAIAVYTNSLPGISSLYNLISGNLNTISHSIPALNLATDVFNLFYNPSSDNMNLITTDDLTAPDTCYIYEINGNTLITLKKLNSFYLPDAFITPNNERYIFSANRPHEIWKFDANYNLTPIDQTGFNLIEDVLYAYDTDNDELYVLGWNIDSTNNGTSPVLKLTAYKLQTATGISETKDLYYSTSISPNPASDVINLNIMSNANLSYSISNMVGQTIKMGVLKTSSVDVSSINNGIYFISLYDENKKVYTSKFVIQRK